MYHNDINDFLHAVSLWPMHKSYSSSVMPIKHYLSTQLLIFNDILIFYDMLSCISHHLCHGGDKQTIMIIHGSVLPK